MTLNELAKKVYDIAKTKGFHDNPVSIPVVCSNLHGEVSELWEAYRRKKLDSQCDKDTDEPLTCLEEELADILIRTLDASQEFDIDMDRAVRIKSDYNSKRPFKNGGKLV
jgi:NTP pyrophosphatase (non-canonical NTP hydrolase)